VAKQLIATAKTATHDFAIWVINPDFSPSPYTFEIVNWEIDYRAKDNSEPGFIPCVCTFQALINDDDFSVNLRSILQDADGKYVIKITEGLNVVYNGFITPDLGEIEVINGQRFIKFVASDGFQMFDISADTYVWLDAAPVRPFTRQIKEIFEFFDYWHIFDGIAISEHPIPNQAPYTTEGGLYWTGCIQDGMYYKGTTWRTFREILEDILVTFGLQCFQDKGLIVFRSVWYKTPAWYNFYDTSGSFLYRLTGFSATESVDVYTDGLELIKVATRQVYITHNQGSTGIIKNEELQYKNRINYYIGNVSPTGTNYLRYSANLKMRAGVPQGYSSHAYVEWDIAIQYDSYYWNGAAWTLTPSSISYQANMAIVGSPDPTPIFVDFTHSVNNVDTASLPNIGPKPLYITVTATQTAGDPLDGLAATSTLLMEYHSGDPDKNIYYADNTKRRNAINLNYDTEIGDLWQTSQVAFPAAGEIRLYTNTDRTISRTNLSWDTGNNYLLTISAIELAKVSFKPSQYYEIELTKFITYNHTFIWANDVSNVEYKPVNLTGTDKSTTVTYKEWVYGNILTDYLRPDQLLPEL